jgi:erythromycin esterase
MDTGSDGQAAFHEVETAVVTWLRKNALPLHAIEAGNDFSDLLPLKEMLKHVKVVGLGETTHGTREMFQLKHRLVEFLVQEMGFDTFAIEASFSDCQPINDFALHGIGDRASVLTGQWFVVWDTEELSDLVDWMRRYNQEVPDARKVKFHGVDVKRNVVGRKAVLDYLRIVAPERVAATQALFEAFAVEEAKWPFPLDAQGERTLVELLPRLEALISELKADQETYVARSSSKEFNLALRRVRVMQQFILSYVPELATPGYRKGTDRSLFMAENLLFLTEQAEPGAKFILWQHNSHLRVADRTMEDPTLGTVLREKFGDGYFAFGFEFYQGSFQTRKTLPTQLLGDLQGVTLPPSPPGSLAWYLSRTNLGNLILNLRAPVDDAVVKDWLAAPQSMHHVGWLYTDALTDYLQPEWIQKYDGIIFIEETTASRPTANALRAVASRDGL